MNGGFTLLLFIWGKGSSVSADLFSSSARKRHIYARFSNYIFRFSLFVYHIDRVSVEESLWCFCSGVHDALAALLGTQDMCGVMMQFLAFSRGLSPLDRLSETTSRPAAATFRCSVRRRGPAHDHLTAAVVDDDDTVFHLRDVFFIDDSGVEREQRHLESQNIGFSEEGVQIDVFTPRAFASRVLSIAVRRSCPAPWRLPLCERRCCRIPEVRRSCLRASIRGSPSSTSLRSFPFSVMDGLVGGLM